MESLIIDLVDYSFSTFLRYLVGLIPVGRLLMFRNHIDQHHVSKFLFLFYFIFFFSGGLIFLLIFFNVLMMYKNIFFYTFRNFLEFVIITIVSKSRFSHTLVFYSGLFSYMFETFNCSDFCRNAKIRRKLENRPVKLDFSKGGLLFQLVYY